MLWKRLNTETDPKVSLGPFPSFFKELSEISEYLGSVSAIFTFDSFPVFLGPFSPFLGPFSPFLGQFPVFRKSCKLSVC